MKEKIDETLHALLHITTVRKCDAINLYIYIDIHYADEVILLQY